MPVQSPAGNVIQTVQGIRRSPWSSSVGSSNVQIGLTATITPKFSTSKVLIILFLMYDWTRNNSGGGFKLFRGGSELTNARGDAYGSMYRVAADFGANANADQSGMTRSIVYLDSPGSTSSIEYRVYAWAASTAQLTVCGQQYGNGTTNQSDDGRMISTYTLLEIGGS
tara:strand:+ start:841 stop:1344 length:504 start_codon:yes stop_codon:yes gene_type:complete